MAGYHELSKLMTRFPQLMIFRRFDKLDVLNLLYLQADLAFLEQELLTCIRLDAQCSETASTHQSRRAMSAVFETGKFPWQREKTCQIKLALKEYQEALLRTSAMHRLPMPASFDRTFLTSWLTTPEGGNNFLKSFEADQWNDEFESDHVSLQCPSNSFDIWLAHKLSPAVRFIRRHSVPDTDLELGLGPIRELKMQMFNVLGTVCSMCLAAGIPVVSMFALFFINQPLVRLAVITCVTFLFSCVLGMVTKCRRSELFAATAAFVAVQVVFLQGIGGGVQQPL